MGVVLVFVRIEPALIRSEDHFCLYRTADDQGIGRFDPQRGRSARPTRETAAEKDPPCVKIAGDVAPPSCNGRHGNHAYLPSARRIGDAKQNPWFERDLVETVRKSIMAPALSVLSL
jgi:hypothetical protein